MRSCRDSSGEEVIERFSDYGLDYFNEQNYMESPRYHAGELYPDLFVYEWTDQEFLELVLGCTMSRTDARLVALRLLQRHGSLSAVVSLSPRELHLSGSNIKSDSAARLAGISKLLSSAAAVRIERRPLLSNYPNLLAYLQWTIGSAGREELHAFYLDASFRLIRTELLGRGTVTHVHASGRSVVEKALSSNASAILIAHNHPGGNPTPSKDDIKLTADVRDACKAVGITMCDHLVISGADWYSFRLNDFDLCKSDSVQREGSWRLSAGEAGAVARAKSLADAVRRKRTALKNSLPYYQNRNGE